MAEMFFATRRSIKLAVLSVLCTMTMTILNRYSNPCYGWDRFGSRKAKEAKHSRATTCRLYIHLVSRRVSKFMEGEPKNN
ncbi:hypothetical protein F5Y03DRAFT_365065 [Xylaria venustula]|nr:hypothetical protein F5Y03DRAFT_365065 [Xylaria venustula]